MTLARGMRRPKDAAPDPRSCGRRIITVPDGTALAVQF